MVVCLCVCLCVRLLLWDCDGRCYSYYVDVSNNQQNWTRVVNKTTEACRSWQTIVFEKQPVAFIRIVGTHNTANEVTETCWPVVSHFFLLLVNFSCAAVSDSLSEGWVLSLRNLLILRCDSVVETMWSCFETTRLILSVIIIITEYF